MPRNALRPTTPQVTGPRHFIETHPEPSGQLSVLTILNRHPHIQTVSTDLVRSDNLRAQRSRVAPTVAAAASLARDWSTDRAVPVAS